MRKTVMVICAAAALLATSCSKNKKACWGCVLLFSDGYVASYRDSMICDKTQPEISEMKKQVFDAKHMGYQTYQVNRCSKLR